MGTKIVKRLITVIMVLAGTGLAAPTAFAASNNPSQSNHIRISAVDTNHLINNQSYQNITWNQTPPPDLNTQLKQESDSIQYTQKMLSTLELDIMDANMEISRLQILQTIFSVEIEQRNRILKKKTLAYHSNGGNINYVELFLNSGDLFDLVGKNGIAAKISEDDHELTNEQRNDEECQKNIQTALAEKVSALKILLKQCTDMRTHLDQQSRTLKEQMEKKDREELEKKTQEQQEKKRTELAAAQIDSVKRASVVNTVQSLPNTNQGYIRTIINAGSKYIGHSTYLFGGGRTAYDVANGRFDCSGFVHWALAQAGINVGFSTDSIKTAGRQISAADLQPGDLVFFDTYKKDGHVGIYMGNGKFIGSQCSKGVAIEDMTTGYWKNVFKGHVVRI